MNQSNLDLNKADVFIKEIEGMKTKFSMSYIEAILHYCDMHSIDEEQIAQYVVGPLKEYVSVEAHDLNLVDSKKVVPLPSI